jgi:hypothetical protein
MTFETIGGVPVRLYRVAAMLLLAALISAAVATPWIGIGLNVTPGVWAGLAVDLADGMFYRPIQSDLGYGGTRYMPVAFSLHAGLIRIFGSPVATAYLITYAAAVMLFAGVYFCLVRLNVAKSMAVVTALFSLSAVCVAACVYQLRPDVLSAALNIWGIACCLRVIPGSRRWLFLGAVFFAVAFMSKFTTLFGVAAVIAYWFLNGQRRDAVVLATATTFLIGAGLTLVHIASEGRALESFLACASGGTTFKTLLRGPYRFFSIPRVDAPLFITFAAAGVVFLTRVRFVLCDFSMVFFLLTLAATLIIASDIGSGINHFIDIHVAGTMLCAVNIVHLSRYRFIRYALPTSALIGAFALFAAIAYAQVYFAETRYVDQARIMELVGDSGKPLLSDDPWVPILADERPYVLDNYLLRVMAENDPAMKRDFFEKLDQQFFRAAVLYYAKAAPRGPNRNINIETNARRLYDSATFYPIGFYDRLAQSYVPIEFVGEYLVLLPR